MTDQDIIEQGDVAEAMPARPTRRDLVERGLDALDSSRMSPAKIPAAAGGVSFATIIEVMDFAKAMATAGMMIPKYLRGNPGGCLGITFQAIEWRMSPFQVANKSYAVNDRVGYESQLIHAVIEARAPLQHRLDCRYAGEGGTRRCIVIGAFINGDEREYESPMLKDIRVKNSPLWQDDPDQQLFYYASRSWARKWCPDVLMGIYAREELAERGDLGREIADDAGSGLQSRLVGAEKASEGHRAGHADRELDQLAGAGQLIEHSTVADKAESGQKSGAKATAEPGVGKDTSPPSKRISGLPIGSKKGTKHEKVPKKADKSAEADDASKAAKLSKLIDDEIKQVKTAAHYLKYARKWVSACKDSTELFVRWTAERKLRNALGVTADEREPLDELVAKRREQLEAGGK